MMLMHTNTTETATVQIEYPFTDDYVAEEMTEAARAALIARSMYVPNVGPFSGFTMTMPDEMGTLAGVEVTLQAMFAAYDGGLAPNTYVRFPCSGYYRVRVATDEDTDHKTVTVQRA